MASPGDQDPEARIEVLATTTASQVLLFYHRREGLADALQRSPEKRRRLAGGYLRSLRADAAFLLEAAGDRATWTRGLGVSPMIATSVTLEGGLRGLAETLGPEDAPAGTRDKALQLADTVRGLHEILAEYAQR